MSMKLRGLLADQFQSRMETQLLNDVIIYENVPCEMTFRSAQAYMEHESRKNDYLPVFHLIGDVTEIHGDFPFHISSLYFDEKDKPYLMKDCLYYPNPDELAHLIKTGGFFSRKFKLPEVLDTNVYVFPAMVNLMIVPPSDRASYEIAVSQGNFDTDADKINLPIVYVGIVGSGINRKNDKLLDYYGIDIDDDMNTYALTAESTGYVNPPLMMYVEAPEESMTDDIQAVNNEYTDEYDDRHVDQPSVAKEQPVVSEIEKHADTYQISDEEDRIIAQADREIHNRISRILNGPTEPVTEHDTQLSMIANDPVYENEVEKSAESAEKSDEHDAESYVTEITQEPAVEDVYMDSASHTEGQAIADLTADDFVDETAFDNNKKSEIYEQVEPVSEEYVVIEDRAVSNAESDNQQLVEKQVSPDIPQQMAEVKMDFDTEHNAFVEEKRDDKEDAVVDEKTDISDLRKMEGADVADASAQTKVDEAHAQNAALEAAKTQQTVEIREDMENHDATEKSGNRNVSQDMEDVTEAYDALSKDTDTSQYGNI